MKTTTLVWIILTLVALAFVISLSGCYSATRAKMFSNNTPHHIKQFSCGQVIGEWDSVGRVFSEEHSDGFYFEDMKTRKLVMVSGEVQITLD